jgi:hypothetical protein
MKKKNLLSTAILACSLFQANEGRAQQDLIRLLKNAHLPTGRLGQVIFPFKTSFTASKPTGIKQRLMALYFMNVQGGQFVKVQDSVRYFRPPHVGSTFDYPNAVISTSLYTQPAEPYNPTIVATDITDSVISYALVGNVFSQYTNKKISVLNTQGKIAEQTTSLYSSGTWTNANRVTYVYNAAGQVTVMIQDNWVNNAWLPAVKTICIYDVDDRLTGTGNSLWSNDESTWKESDRHTYTYDANGNWISDVYQNMNGSWVNNNQVTFNYDGSNKRTETTSQAWNGSTWVNTSKLITGYDGSGFRSEDIQKQWDAPANDWRNLSRRLYTYNVNDKQNSTTTEMWDGGSAWVTDTRYDFFYNGEKIEQTIIKNRTNNTWDTAGRFIVTFDANLNGIMLTDETYDDAAGIYHAVDGDSRFMFFYEDYDEPVSIKNILPQIDLSIFPNPAKGILEVRLNDQKIKQVTISDLQGKTVYSSKSAIDSNELTLPVAHLSDGIYTLRASTEKGSGSKMFVIKH